MLLSLSGQRWKIAQMEQNPESKNQNIPLEFVKLGVRKTVLFRGCHKLSEGLKTCDLNQILPLVLYLEFNGPACLFLPPTNLVHPAGPKSYGSLNFFSSYISCC